MKPRLRDVAGRAGVSEATVSRVVNHKPGVAAATRLAVLRAIEELGYEPAGLVPVSRGAFAGVIVPELDNPVFPAFAQAIEHRLAGHGLVTVVCTATIEGTQEPEYVALLRERGAAGLIVVSGTNADRHADQSGYAGLVDDGVPLVLVNGVVNDLRIPHVNADEAAAAQLGVRHLADLGHRAIGLAIGPRRYEPTQRKLAGYLRGIQAMAGHGELGEDLVVETVYSVEGGHAATARLLELGATAVLAASDLMALGALRAVHERGLRVPEDVSVVGYDDIWPAAYSNPPLTTLRQPVMAMGAAAANALVTVIDGDSASLEGEYLFRSELIVRGSSGPSPDRPGGDPSGAPMTAAGAASGSDRTHLLK
jgi:LacI family transcriptional regulator, repressor for deo operon, udp, cdd, tsx, nupC, and nupG